MKVAFVILTKNSERTMDKCLREILRLKSKFDLEIIVVDGGSIDNTLSIVKHYQEHLGVKILYDQGKGLGYARDIGWRSSSAEYIVMLDSDVLLNEEFIAEAIKVLERDKELGAVAAKLKPISLDKGWFGRFQEKNLAIHLHHQDPPYPAEAVALHTACTVFKRKVLEEVGGFDEFFDLAKEDSDISYRIRKRGYKLSYLNYYAIHLERARILKTNFRYGRSYVLISRKHPNMEKLWRFKNIVLTSSIVFPILQPLIYLYYLRRYIKLQTLSFIEKVILSLIELLRQDLRTIGMLYQLILDRLQTH
ncbi:MAG: glycosyltransferase [Candidatus Bathyarchaeia archaeon]|nr:glycosyltransferase [Thermoproteota archaeon]